MVHPNRHSLVVLQTLIAAVCVATLIGRTPEAYSQESAPPRAHAVLGEPFPAFVARLASMTTPDERAHAIASLIDAVRNSGQVLTEDSVVYLFYTGEAGRVTVASDLNEWKPSATPMQRVPGTDFFSVALTTDPAAHFEYKFVVDSNWILDPHNPHQAMGGFGPNSDVRMPLYRPSSEVLYRPEIPHGVIDTTAFASRVLGRSYPVMIYRPPGMSGNSLYPTIYVTDGGEYLSLGQMNNVLDNLIADGRIQPVIGVFIDPRTDPSDSRTSMRMTDYVMNDSFVTFIAEELRPALSRSYPIATEPSNSAIIGASLGGLISTYAPFRRPDVFGLSAAQSPAYEYPKDSTLTLIAHGPRKPFRMYLETGTIHDAEKGARMMRAILTEKGYPVRYLEVPEGHNWVHWSARLADILTYFWGKH